MVFYFSGFHFIILLLIMLNALFTHILVIVLFRANIALVSDRKVKFHKFSNSSYFNQQTWNKYIFKLSQLSDKKWRFTERHCNNIMSHFCMEWKQIYIIIIIMKPCFCVFQHVTISWTLNTAPPHAVIFSFKFE